MMNASSNGVIPIITESGLIHLDDHGISKFIISSHTPRPCKTATSSPLLSSSSLSPNLRYVRRKLTPSPRALRLSSSLMEVVSSLHLLSSAGFNKMLTLPCTFPKELMAHASRLVDDEEPPYLTLTYASSCTAAPDDKAGATSTSVSREVHLPDDEAQRRAVLIGPI
ncbi:hypothetical protein Bca101_073042 [Brassica carinata]